MERQWSPQEIDQLVFSFFDRMTSQIKSKRFSGMDDYECALWVLANGDEALGLSFCLSYIYGASTEMKEAVRHEMATRLFEKAMAMHPQMPLDSSDDALLFHAAMTFREQASSASGVKSASRQQKISDAQPSLFQSFPRARKKAA
jgi:hypothetical protein